MWNLIQNDTKEPVYRTETDLKILRSNLRVTKGKTEVGGGDILGGWGWHTHTTIHKVDDSLGLTA